MVVKVAVVVVGVVGWHHYYELASSNGYLTDSSKKNSEIDTKWGILKSYKVYSYMYV